MTQQEDFNTLQDFLKKYPLDEITLPVCILPPEEKGDYWLIQLALPMKNLVKQCCVWNANTHEMSKYKMKALRLYKDSMGVSYDNEKRYRSK